MALSMPNHWFNSAIGPGDTEVLVTPTAGNWLVAAVFVATVDNSQPAISVGDWSRNIWTLAYTPTTMAFESNNSTQQYVQIWVCPNVRYDGWPNLGVYASVLPYNSTDTATVNVNVFEIAGMVNGFLTVDSVALKITTASTTFSMAVPAPTGGADCLMIAAANNSMTGTTNVTLTSAGWTQTDALNAAGPQVNSDIVWRESTVTQTASWSITSSSNWVGAVASLRVTGIGPTQPNPNWPAVDFQLGLGYNLSTPLNNVIWTSILDRLTSFDHERGIQYELGLVQSDPTDLVLRNDDGALSPRAAGIATATATGTTTTFICTATDAADVNVADYFQLTTSTGALKEFTVFKVLSITIVGSVATIAFIRADRTGNGALTAPVTGDKYLGAPIDIYVPYRIVATWNGKQYPVVTGWIEQWPIVWEDPHWGDSYAVGIDPIATLVAKDYTPVQGEILRRNPHSYWPLSDAATATTAQNISGVGTAVLTQTTASGGAGSGAAQFGGSTQNVDFFAGSGVVGGLPVYCSQLGDPGSGWSVEGLTSAQMSGADGFALVATGVTFPSIANGVTICGSVLLTDENFILMQGATSPVTIFAISNQSGSGFHGRTIQFLINPTTNGPEISWWDKTTGGFNSATSATYPNVFGVYTPTNWAMTFNQTSWKIYMEGVLANSGTMNIVPNFDIIDVGGQADLYGNGHCFNAIHSHVAVFPRQLTAGEISDISSSMSNGYLTAVYGTDQTIARKLDTVNNVNPRILNFTTTKNGDEILGSSMADKVTQLADYNADKLFTDAAGQIQFRARSRSINQTIKATIGDRPDLGEIPFVGDVNDLQINYDPTYIYNQVIIENDGITSNTDGFGFQNTTTTVTVQDATSIAKYGLRTLQRRVSFTTDTMTLAVANYLLSQYKAARLRVASVLIDAGKNNAAFAFVLGVEVGDLVTFNRRPIGAPMITMNCIVLDIQHSVAADKWETTLIMGAAPV